MPKYFIYLLAVYFVNLRENPVEFELLRAVLFLQFETHLRVRGRHDYLQIKFILVHLLVHNQLL